MNSMARAILFRWSRESRAIPLRQTGAKPEKGKVIAAEIPDMARPCPDRRENLFR